MANLPYVDVERVSALGETLTRIIKLRGEILNLYRILGNQPSALTAFMGMSEYVRDGSALPAQIRELTILATAQALDVPYEWFHHERVARRVGVNDQKLAQLVSWRESSAFSPIERSAIAYAEEVGRTRQVSGETFAALKSHFTPAQIVDLALTVGWYHLCAALIKPLGIEIEG